MNILRPSAPERKKLDAIRAKIADALKTIKETEQAPLAPEDTRARIRGAVNAALTRDGDWAIRALTRYGRATPDGRNHTLPETEGRGVPWGAFIALLGRDVVEERILKLCAAEPGERGLPKAAREARVADLRAKVAELERAEEREVLVLEDAGHAVLRRADASAEVLLEIWQAMSPPTPGPTPRGPAVKPAMVGTSEGRHINERAQFASIQSYVDPEDL